VGVVRDVQVRPPLQPGPDEVHERFERTLLPIAIGRTKRVEANGSPVENVSGLRMACELGVPRFVAPVPELRRSIHLHEEIGFAAPAVGQDDALVDDVGAGTHRGSCLLGGRNPFSFGARPRNAHDAAPLAFEAFEMPPLVGLALGGEHVGLGLAPFLDRARAASRSRRIR
jgi:hypothetical protein